MKISYNWLKDYIQTDETVEEIGKILTDTGLEVEKIHTIETIPGGLAGLVIGEVLTKEKHPDADRLNVTTVNVGSEVPLQIVCGAPNVDAGQKVVVATVGTTIHPTNGEPFKIKKSKIRGVESFGMICAEDEIGIGTDHDGIMVLDAAAPIGLAANKFFQVENDYQYEIGLTPNRADGMSHTGVARDLLCALKHFEKTEADACIAWPPVDDFIPDSTIQNLPIEVEAAEACPRYAGLIIEDVKVSPSPEWLQNRLRSIGLTPINNVVDVTNFVLHELGQPLHAFDAKKIEGQKIVVKTLSEETKFTTLDETERSLNKEDLMICDGNGNGMCMAGVFGGIHSGVTQETTAVFLESAYFNPVSVRKTAKRHGLNTDASFRFERGVDPNQTTYALKRAALMIAELTGGKYSNYTDIYPNPILDFKVELTWHRLNQIAGIEIPKNTAKNILKWLDIKIERESDEKLQLNVPAYRVDVQREIDVIEEILRIYGFNNIPIPEKVNASLSYAIKPNKGQLQNTVSNFLSANGFSEIMSNSLTKASYATLAESKHIHPEEHVAMLNPLSSDLGVLRQSLLFSGLEAISYNINRQENNLKFYEFGKSYKKTPDGYKETGLLGLFLTGSKEVERWNANKGTVSFYTLKGTVESILKKLGIYKNYSVKGTNNDLLEDGIEWTIAKQKVGDIGWVKPSILAKMGIKQKVYYACLNWDTIFGLMKMNKTKFSPMSKFPSVRRDLSLLLDKTVDFAAIEQVARKMEKKLLKEIDLFDVYEGKNLAENKKSYAVKFVLQDEEKTLKDKQIEAIMNKIQQALQKELGAELR